MFKVSPSLGLAGQHITMGVWLVILVFLLCSFLLLLVRRFRTPDLVSAEGLVIFISGCDSGIGKKLAECFSGLGCLVIAGCLNPGASDLPDSVFKVKLDIADEESVVSAMHEVERILKSKGKELWALVNNAGVCVYGPFEWQTARQRDWQVDINLKGTMRLTRHCIPLLKRSRGRIITVSSVNGSIAYPGLSVYCATKFALEGFSNALRLELGPRHGIRVIVVRPADYARVTSIMSGHERNAQEMWDDIPKEDQDQIEEEFRKYNAAVLKNYGLSSPTSWEGSPLLRDMREAVLGKNPSPRYLSAPLLHKLFYVPFAMCPEWLSDFVLTAIQKKVIDGGQ